MVFAAGCDTSGGIAGYNDSNGTIATCYWDGNVSAGSNGGSSADNTTKVEGSVTWETAQAAMNSALKGVDWHYVTGSDVPLTLTK